MTGWETRVGVGATDGVGDVAGPTAGWGRDSSANPTTATIRAAATRPPLAKRRTVRPVREADSCPTPGTALSTASMTGSTDRGWSEAASQSRIWRSVRDWSLMPSLRPPWLHRRPRSPSEARAARSGVVNVPSRRGCRASWRSPRTGVQRANEGRPRSGGRSTSFVKPRSSRSRSWVWLEVSTTAASSASSRNGML